MARNNSNVKSSVAEVVVDNPKTPKTIYVDLESFDITYNEEVSDSLDKVVGGYDVNCLTDGVEVAVYQLFKIGKVKANLTIE